MAQRITGHTELIGLIATPIRHSLSPMMHNTAFEALGLDYAYLTFDFPPEELANAVLGLKALGVRGFNVSMPYKGTIIPLLDEISPTSRLTGCVNTVLNRDGRLYGTITDGIGYVNSLREIGFEVKGRKITLLGCGGAGTAMAVQAALDGAAEIAIFNGNLSRAEKTAAVINANTSCVAHAYPLTYKARLRGEIAESDLLSNATSVGMGKLEGVSLIDDPALLRPELICTDVIYSPAETAFLRLARECGCVTQNGLGMVIHQGAEAFRLWMGQTMPLDAVKAALREIGALT